MSAIDRKIFITLLFAIVATVVGIGIVLPLLPVYAHEMGASGFSIGLIFGAFALSRTVFLPVFGRLSDTKGRKTFIVPGLLAYALISLLFVYATDARALVAIRLLQGVASAMLMPVIQAYVVDITPPGQEGRIMGIYSTFVLVGLGVGPLIGGLITDAHGLAFSFMCMGVLALIGFLLCMWWLPAARTERVAARPTSPTSWHGLIEDRSLSGMFVFRFAYVTCIGIIWAFVPLLGSIRLSLSASAVGTLIMVGILGSGMLNRPMGALADRVNRRAMVTVGGLVAAAAVTSFTWATSYRDMLTSALLFGIGGGVCMPALMAMATHKGTEKDAMGSVMGMMTVAHSAGMMVGAIMAGIMMDLFEWRGVFPAGGAVMLCGVIVFLLTARSRARVAHRTPFVFTPPR